MMKNISQLIKKYFSNTISSEARINSHSAGGQTCNYADNYYGDQICIAKT